MLPNVKGPGGSSGPCKHPSQNGNGRCAVKMSDGSVQYMAALKSTLIPTLVDCTWESLYNKIVKNKWWGTSTALLSAGKVTDLQKHKAPGHGTTPDGAGQPRVAASP